MQILIGKVNIFLSSCPWLTKILTFSQLLLYYKAYVQWINQYAVLNHIVSFTCCLRKHDSSVRVVSKSTQILTIDELHLRKIIKLLVIALRKGGLLEKINSK